MNQRLAFALLPLALAAGVASAQDASPAGDPKATEQWTPVPPVVTPGRSDAAPPSDAIVLFDGRNLDQWEASKDHSPAHWNVHDGVATVDKATGNIQTRRRFGSYQLHLEWRVPEGITGDARRAATAACSWPRPDRATKATRSRSWTRTATRPTSTARPPASTSRRRRWSTRCVRRGNGRATTSSGPRPCSVPTGHCGRRPT